MYVYTLYKIIYFILHQLQVELIFHSNFTGMYQVCIFLVSFNCYQSHYLLHAVHTSNAYRNINMSTTIGRHQLIVIPLSGCYAALVAPLQLNFFTLVTLFLTHKTDRNKKPIETENARLVKAFIRRRRQSIRIYEILRDTRTNHECNKCQKSSLLREH